MTSTTTTTTTNLGPLTTTFTPPGECGHLNLDTRSGGGVYGYLDQRCYPVGIDGETRLFRLLETCFPGDYGSYIESGDGDHFYTVPVYSPGSVCPSGFEEACTIERHEGEPGPETSDYMTSADWEVWNILKYDQTAIGCCPSGYKCADDDTILCTSDPTPGNIVKGTSYGLHCLPTNTTATIAKSQTDDVASAHRLLLIQGSGRPVPETDTSEADDDSESDKDDDGLGLVQGNIVAFILPITAAFFILFVGVPCFIMRRRKRRRLKAEQTEALVTQPPAPAPAPAPPGGGLVSTQTGLDSYGEAPPSYGEAIALVPRPDSSHQEETQSDTSSNRIQENTVSIR